MANRVIKFQKGIITTNLNDALNMFNKMIQKQPLPSAVKFTNLLDVVTNMKHFSCSIRLFKQMCALGVPYNEETINIVIKCYSQLKSTKQGFTVLGYCFKRGGVVPNVLAYNTILNGFVLEDQTRDAEALFKKLFINKNLCEPNLVTYNTIIKALCKTGNNFTSVALLRLMDGRGCSPNDVSYNTIINGLCNDLLIDDAFKLFKEMVYKQHISPNVDTYNSLMYALSKLGRWDDLRTMLKQMEDENISPNVKTFNILVDALCKQGKVKEAQVVIGIMDESGMYPPDVVTYNSLIHGYTLQGEMSKAKTVFDSLAFRGVKPNVDTYNELLNGYQKNLKKKEAFRLFHDLTRKTSKNKHNLLPNYVTVYIMLLLGPMSPAKRSSPATFKSIGNMQSQRKFPDEVHYKCPLQHTGDDYEDALDLFHFMDGSKLNLNIDVYNIVIDVVGKCKKFDISRRLYHDLFVKGLRPDVETYAVMISGLCRGGLLKDAKQLFLKMKRSDCQPNSVIFNELIQGYLKNKPLDDVSRLIEELKEERAQSLLQLCRC